MSANKYASMDINQLKKVKTETAASNSFEKTAASAALITPDMVSAEQWKELEAIQNAVSANKSDVLNETKILGIWILGDTKKRMDLVIDSEYPTASMEWCNMCLEISKMLHTTMIFNYKEDFEKQNENFIGLTDHLRQTASEEFYCLYKR